MCLHPITVRYSNSTTGPTGSRTALVPCGKCPECLRAYQSAWTVRLLHHLRAKQYGVFVTLTYSDENVPYKIDPLSGEVFPTVCKSHVQQFLKTCRRTFLSATGKKITFFLTSEYGPRTLRPHYHAVLFSVTLDEWNRYFAPYWRSRYGFTTESAISAASPKSFRSCRYVAKYCSKGMFENPRVSDGLVDPTFHLISKGIGKSYLTDETINYHLSKSFDSRFDSAHRPTDGYLNSLKGTLRVNVAGFDYKVPRYYKEVLFGSRKGLQSAYADYLSKESLRLRDEKFGLVQSDGKPNHEAYKIALDTDISETVQREKNAKTALVRQYDKSKL